MNLQSEMTAEVELEQFARGYLDLIYASALRQMNGDTASAADVTQTVLVILVKKSRARQLPREAIMTGWLLNVTRYAVMQYKRAVARRARHETEAGKFKAAEAETPQIESDIRTALDSAILLLGAVDREVVVRRYLREENLAEVAAAVGMSENTAGRRVARALEKLRKILLQRGVAAPAVAVTAVLSAEACRRAPAACGSMPTAGNIATGLARQVIWKMAAGKAAGVLGLTVLLLALVSGIGITILKTNPPQNTTPIPPQATALAQDSPVQDSPGPVTVNVTKVLEGPSEMLLKQLLAGLAENQRKFQSIHVVGTDRSQTYDPARKTWTDSLGLEGQAWMEAAAPRRFRSEITRGETRTVPVNQPWPLLGVINTESYSESWDGTSSRRLYGLPHSAAKAETFDSRSHRSDWLLGKDFSMQLPWDEETAGDAQGNTIKVIDHNPLDPAALAKMKISARRVLLEGGQEAMELSIDNPDLEFTRSETFWFDAHRGYGLLARRDVMAMALNGTILRQITRVVKQMTEAAPGIFYPSKGIMYWEEHGNPFTWEQFEATTAIANEPLAAELFHPEFPHGISVIDYHNGRGAKRIEK